MLYDVLPPLFLFASIGGIIVVISRVSLRMKRETLSTQMHANAAAISRRKAERAILRPGRKGISLVGNRIMHSFGTLRSSVTQTRIAATERREKRITSREERREEKLQLKENRKQEKAKAKRNNKNKEEKLAPEKSVEQPTSGWRDRLSSVASRGKSRLSSIQKITDRMPSTKGVIIEEQTEEIEEVVETTIAEETPATKEVVKPKPKKKTPPLAQKTPQVTKSEKKVTGKQAVVSRKNTQADIVKKEDLSETRRRKLLKKVRRKKENLSSPLQDAKSALKERNYQRVEDILLPYIVQHTQDTSAYMLLGHAAFGQESWDEALEIFEQVEKMNATQDGLKAAKGRTALRCGKMTLALQTLQRAHDDDPEDRDVLEDLITIAKRMDNPALKKSAQEQLIQLKAQEEQSI